VRKPHEYYIKYLISLGLDMEGINKSLISFSLSPIEDSYLVRLQAELETPSDFRPNEKSHDPTTAWLRKHKIYSLWHEQDFPHVTRAFQMLQTPKVRQIVDIFTLSAYSFSDISNMLMDKFDFATEAASLEAYTLYFNNYALLTLEEIRSDAASRREYWRIAALMGDVNFIRWYLGLETRVTREKIIKDTLNTAYFRIREGNFMHASESLARSYGQYLGGIQWGIEESAKLDQTEEEMSAPLLKGTRLEEPVFAGELPEGEVPALSDAPVLKGAKEEIHDVT